VQSDANNSLEPALNQFVGLSLTIDRQIPFASVESHGGGLGLAFWLRIISRARSSSDRLVDARRAVGRDAGDAIRMRRVVVLHGCCAFVKPRQIVIAGVGRL
jgi:hypothetical protein